MGVNTRIYLPHDVRIIDVANVIGILAGLEYSEEYLIPGVSVKSSSSASCAHIDITAPKGKTLIDGEENHYTLFNFEAGEDAGHYGRHLGPPSSAFWIAVGKKLAEFFGGAVIYTDGESIKASEAPVKFRKRGINNPEDGVPWHRWKKRIREVKPLTEDDLMAAAWCSAYDNPLHKGNQKPWLKRDQ